MGLKEVQDYFQAKGIKNEIILLNESSATVELAAKALGRDYIGFEICQEYVDLANARIKGTSVKKKEKLAQLELF